MDGLFVVCVLVDIVIDSCWVGVVKRFFVLTCGYLRKGTFVDLELTFRVVLAGFLLVNLLTDYKFWL